METHKKNSPNDFKLSVLSNISLTEKKIGKSNYYISLPNDYVITEKNGEDFSVFHFEPTDTTEKNKLTFGFYFGNFPHEFDTANDSCQLEIIEGEILGNSTDWKIFNCHENYSVQTIAENKDGESWNQKIHAFGNFKNRTDLDIVLNIFGTLRKGD